MQEIEEKLESFKNKMRRLLDTPGEFEITTDCIISEKGVYFIKGDKPVNLYINPNIHFIDQVLIYPHIEGQGFNLHTVHKQSIWCEGEVFNGVFTLLPKEGAFIKGMYLNNSFHIINLHVMTYYINRKQHDIRSNHFEII